MSSARGVFNLLPKASLKDTLSSTVPFPDCQQLCFALHLLTTTDKSLCHIKRAQAQARASNKESHGPAFKWGTSLNILASTLDGW